MADALYDEPVAAVYPIPRSPYAPGEISPVIAVTTTYPEPEANQPSTADAGSVPAEDTELVRLQHEWEASCARCYAASRRNRTIGMSSFDDAAWVAEIALSDALETTIIRTPASGRDGLWAKITLLNNWEGDHEAEMKRWMEHFIAEGADSFTQATLYSLALDVWRMIRPVEIGMGLAGEGAAPLSTSTASEAA